MRELAGVDNPVYGLVKIEEGVEVKEVGVHVREGEGASVMTV